MDSGRETGSSPRGEANAQSVSELPPAPHVPAETSPRTDDAEALAQYRQAVEKDLAANQRLRDTRDGNQQIGGALGKAERFV